MTPSSDGGRFTTDWDDPMDTRARIARNSDQDAGPVLDRAESLASERGKDDAPNDVCGACMDVTPLAYENASDVGTITFMDGLREATRKAVEHATAGQDDGWWVTAEVNDAYIDAFYRACGDVSACWVCRDATVDPDMECGHVRHDEPCPLETEGE